MKYYKILRKDLIHHGYQYQEGLNVDPKEWESGECEPGGFYFTTAEHIFKFVSYGDLICDIEIAEDAKVEYYDIKSKSNKIIISNVRSLWEPNTIKTLLEAGANIHEGGDYALRWSSECGHIEAVKLLLEADADVHAGDDYAFRWSSENGHTEVVKLLLEAGANIHAWNDHALRCVSRKGYTEIAKLLLESGADVHAENDYALRHALENGHTEIVKLLKQYS